LRLAEVTTRLRLAEVTTRLRLAEVTTRLRPANGWLRPARRPAARTGPVAANPGSAAESERPA
ncbi:hypothetical protein, partial [Rugosimonospora africana]|uniref:hypothetical protein n=1 Tax=Rugosimonospora africana TaxID=556532 RepID=UPI0019437921